MKVTQLHPTNETMWEMLTRDDVYFVQFSEPKAKKSEGHKREMPSLPYGLSFKKVSNMSIHDVVELLEKGKAAIVEVKREES